MKIESYKNRLGPHYKFILIQFFFLELTSSTAMTSLDLTNHSTYICSIYSACKHYLLIFALFILTVNVTSTFTYFLYVDFE